MLLWTSILDQLANTKHSTLNESLQALQTFHYKHLYSTFSSGATQRRSSQCEVGVYTPKRYLSNQIRLEREIEGLYRQTNYLQFAEVHSWQKFSLWSQLRRWCRATTVDSVRIHDDAADDEQSLTDVRWRYLWSYAAWLHVRATRERGRIQEEIEIRGANTGIGTESGGQEQNPEGKSRLTESGRMTVRKKVGAERLEWPHYYLKGKSDNIIWKGKWQLSLCGREGEWCIWKVRMTDSWRRQ